MIKCIPIDQYPKGESIVERILKDQNDFEWRMARVENGFAVAYCGDPYFKKSFFEFYMKGEFIQIENTGCVVFDKKPAELAVMAYLIENSYTDEIWERFEWYFERKNMKTNK